MTETTNVSVPPVYFMGRGFGKPWASMRWLGADAPHPPAPATWLSWLLRVRGVLL